MSYKALYRKYRPTNFNSIVGQDHIVTTLKNVVGSGKLSHAYLFVGPHGTGKTTSAHVFAKSINCVDRHATDKFAMCETFDWAKGAMDIIEIDAASNNGVAEVRQLIENARYAPTSLKYKVYIIDEVHMLSKGAFNALLKTLEEPPKHVVFILATTEPGKVPATVLSRVQRYNFRRISDSVIVSALKDTLTKEGISYEDLSLLEIAKQANGSLRDALSIADQTSAFGNGTITFEYISKAYGILSIDTQVKLLLALSTSNVKEVLSLSRAFFLEGIDLFRLSNSLLDIVKDWIIYNQIQDTSYLTVLSSDNVEGLAISKTFAYNASDALLKLTSDIKKSVSPKQTFELALLSLMNDTSSSENVSISEQRAEVKIFNNNEEITSPKVEEVIKQNMTPTAEIKVEKEFEEKKPSQEITQTILSDTLKKLNVALEETAEINVSKAIQNVEEEEATIMENSAPPEEPQENLSDEGINITNTNVIKEPEDDPQESTDEFDIEKLFDMTGDTPLDTTQETKVYSIDEIINLLLQADKSDIANVRSKLNSSSQLVDGAIEQSYSVLLKSIKVITAGPKFILLTSEQKTIVREINQLKLKDDFSRFVDRVIGRQVLVYAINKEQFEEVKEIWSQYANTNTLPEPKAIIIDRPEPEVKKSKVETYGEDIFGDLFN